VIELRRAQLSLTEGLFAEGVGDLYLWEDWMRQVDQILMDPELLDVFFTCEPTWCIASSPAWEP
jgi:hypothetical protein